MFVVDQPVLAIIFCLLTMLCWGSWNNGQKIVTQSAPLAIFYRDYVYGMLLFAVILTFTLGSLGSDGRSFLKDIGQADVQSMLLALAGGVVFNVNNTLFTVGIKRSGLSIAMPIGTGLSLAVGLVVNYLAEPEGNVTLLAIGGGIVLAAMAASGLAYHAKEQERSSGNSDNSGIWISLVGGLVAGFFFRLVSASMADDPAQPDAGKLTPYSALLLFCVGVNVSNPLIEWLIKRLGWANDEPPTPYREVPRRQHLIGLASGLLWGLGMAGLLLGSPKAGDAVSYGLSQGATIVSVLWGLFLWKEFEGAPPKANRYLWIMGVTYIAGLVLIILARS